MRLKLESESESETGVVRARGRHCLAFTSPSARSGLCGVTRIGGWSLLPLSKNTADVRAASFAWTRRDSVGRQTTGFATIPPSAGYAGLTEHRPVRSRHVDGWCVPETAVSSWGSWGELTDAPVTGHYGLPGFPLSTRHADAA